MGLCLQTAATSARVRAQVSCGASAELDDGSSEVDFVAGMEAHAAGAAVDFLA
jgi:hypothetical protein